MPKNLPLRIALTVLALALVLCGTLPDWNVSRAANHREAPLTALDPKADITDYYAFVSYDDPNKVTFILSVDPLLEPANGPNYFPFDPDIRYAIKIDNDNDAVEDISFEFRFTTEIRLPGVFTGFVGAGNGIFAPAYAPKDLNGNKPPTSAIVVPPAITSLDGPGSIGLGLRQSYSVTMVKGPSSRPSQRIELTAGQPVYAAPSNVGPRTMPDYPALARQGIYNVGNGIRVFAGTTDDAFWIDLGATFDSLNFRATGFALPGVLMDGQEADDTRNFASDSVSGYNVNSIAIGVPISMVTRTGTKVAATNPAATIGTWGVTSRQRVRVLPGTPGRETQNQGPWVQIQRMGNALFNEVIIGTGSKDKFSMSEPKDDAQFASFALDPLLARVLNAVYGIPVPDAPRTDLLPLVQYVPPIAAPGTTAGPVADLLRLNTGVPPTAASARKRMGLLAGDAAGYPNGRRLSDDVTDISARAVAGILAGGTFAAFPYNPNYAPNQPFGLVLGA
ncbi:MAG: DUF4331 domain-containing protein [Acidimicrobiia bacterium]|nr:DUF4331 domain-containing protein [Acidimicrobiia bacterium]